MSHVDDDYRAALERAGRQFLAKSLRAARDIGALTELLSYAPECPALTATMAALEEAQRITEKLNAAVDALALHLEG